MQIFLDKLCILIAACAIFYLNIASPAYSQVLIDFDELDTFGQQFFDGYGETAVLGTWESQGAEFVTNQFGPGWSYSKVNDTTTAGFGNQFASITGQDFSLSGNYALVNSFQPNGAYMNLPAGQIPESALLTNSTFAFLSMRDGDSFAKQFGGDTGNDPDWFRAIITGFDQPMAQGNPTGSVTFYLADFRFTDNSLDFIVDSWELVDLTDLNAARSIGITFESSDVGDFGINTPTYFVMDELALIPDVMVGDVNGDGVIDLLDIGPFVQLLTDGEFQIEADINQDGIVDLLDVGPFVEMLSS